MDHKHVSQLRTFLQDLCGSQATSDANFRITRSDVGSAEGMRFSFEREVDVVLWEQVLQRFQGPASDVYWLDSVIYMGSRPQREEVPLEPFLGALAIEVHDWKGSLRRLREHEVPPRWALQGALHDVLIFPLRGKPRSLWDERTRTRLAAAKRGLDRFTGGATRDLEGKLLDNSLGRPERLIVGVRPPWAIGPDGEPHRPLDFDQGARANHLEDLERQASRLEKLAEAEEEARIDERVAAGKAKRVTWSEPRAPYGCPAERLPKTVPTLVLERHGRLWRVTYDGAAAGVQSGTVRNGQNMHPLVDLIEADGKRLSVSSLQRHVGRRADADGPDNPKNVRNKLRQLLDRAVHGICQALHMPVLNRRAFKHEGGEMWFEEPDDLRVVVLAADGSRG